MAPGFALVLLAVALAALAPIVLLVALACCFSVALRPLAVRCLVSGATGGLVAVASFALLAALFAPSQPQAQPEVSLVLFGAGFSGFALSLAAFPLLRRFFKKSVSHHA